MFKNKMPRWIQKMSPGFIMACGVILSSFSLPIESYATTITAGAGQTIEEQKKLDGTSNSIQVTWDDHKHTPGAYYTYNTAGFTFTIIDPSKAAYNNSSTWFKCTGITKNEDGTYTFESESTPIGKTTMPNCDLPFQPDEYQQLVQDGWYNSRSSITFTGDRLETIKEAYAALGGDWDDPNMPIAYVLDGILNINARVSTGTQYQYGTYTQNGYTYLSGGGTNYELGNPYWGNLYTYGDGWITTKDLNTGGELSSKDYEGAGGMIGSDAIYNFEKHGVHNHYRYCYVKGVTTPPTEPPEGSPEKTSFAEEGSSGRNYPEYYTWNNSDQFDIGKGIPSSESYTNGYLANWWYGSYSWGKTYESTRDYTLHWTGMGVLLYENRNGDTKRHPYKCSINVDTSRKAQYYAITTVNIKELQTAKVKNDSIGSVSYSNWNGKNIYNTLPVTCIINGKDVTASGSTAVQSYTSNTENHITWQVGNTNMGSVTAKPSYTNYDADDFIRMFNLKNKADTTSVLTVKAHNDCLIVNGKVYVDSTEVTSHEKNKTAVGPRVKDIDVQALSFNNENSGGDFKERYDQQIVTIPVEKKNGKYPTTLTVTYGSRAANNGSVEESSKYGAEAIWSTYKKNEPVVVHTPVISPIKITDSETNTQLIHTPKSNYSGSTNVSDDTTNEYENTVYKLRLDGTYTMQFQPYQWFSNEFGNLKGYENTNWTADRYDSYVKDKTVRFPFDVSVTNTDGAEKYYKIGADGYTEWIEVDNEFKFYVTFSLSC